MKKLMIGLIVTTNCIFAGIQDDKFNYKEFDKIPRIEFAKVMAREMAQSMSLPMKIDNSTNLIAIYSFDTTICITKKIIMQNPKVKKLWIQKKKIFINLMLKQDAQNTCYNPMWKYMIYKRNIIPEFNYVDKNNKPLFKYTIEIEDCNKLK